MRRVIADARAIAEHVRSSVESGGRPFDVAGLHREPRFRQEGVLLRLGLLHTDALDLAEQRTRDVEPPA